MEMSHIYEIFLQNVNIEESKLSVTLWTVLHYSVTNVHTWLCVWWKVHLLQ